MRITVSISGELLNEAKRVAQERKVALEEVIDDALRLGLKTQPKGEPQSEDIMPFVMSGGSGVRPGVNLNDNASLLEPLEDQ
ncbi:MAG: type II toxin-antitoxin system VapB family antitoxin [Opitutales bacterium]